MNMQEQFRLFVEQSAYKRGCDATIKYMLSGEEFSLFEHPGFTVTLNYPTDISSEDKNMVQALVRDMTKDPE